MDDSVLGRVGYKSHIQENEVLNSNTSNPKKIETPTEKAVKDVSKEIFEHVNSDANSLEHSKLDDHSFKQIEFDDDSDEALLGELEKQDFILQEKEETNSNDELEIQNQGSKELNQVKQEDTQKEKETQKAETHQHKATAHRSVERNELAGAHRLNLDIESLKSLAKNAYVYRKDGGFQNSLEYARLTNQISANLKSPSLLNEILRKKTPSQAEPKDALKEQTIASQKSLSNQQEQLRASPAPTPSIPTPSVPRENLRDQNLIIVKNNIIYVPENLQHEFTPGEEIELPKENGEMQRVVIDHVVILNQEEYSEFRENMSVVIEESIHVTPQASHHVEEGRKRERSEGQDAQDLRPLKHEKRDLSENQSIKPNDIKRSYNAPIVEETMSPSEKRKQDIQKLEKILDEKYKKTIDSNKKENLAHEEINFFTQKANVDQQLTEQANIKIQVVNEEILQTCIMLQTRDDISPQEKEKYRKIEIKIKEVSSRLTQNIGSRDNPVSEKVKALKEYFEEVSTNVLEISHSSVNNTKVAPKSR